MISPLHNNVLIKPFPTEEVTKGGIIIPELSQERPAKGIVVAIGEKVTDTNIKVGITVSHIKNCGIQIDYDGLPYYILRDVECLAIIE